MQEYIGIIVLSLGIISFIFNRKTSNAISLKGIAFALGTSIFIFLYSTIDSFGIRVEKDPLSYISWLFSIKALVLFIPMVVLGKLEWEMVKNEVGHYAVAGILAFLGYSIAVFAFLNFHTAIILSLRSSSILFVFLLSIIVLKEKPNVYQFIATILTVLGMALILASP